MKLLINYNIYITITLLLYDTIDRSKYRSEKERWIRELWIDITKRSRCGKMKKFNNIYGGFWDVMEVEILLGC